MKIDAPKMFADLSPIDRSMFRALARRLIAAAYKKVAEKAGTRKGGQEGRIRYLSAPPYVHNQLPIRRMADMSPLPANMRTVTPNMLAYLFEAENVLSPLLYYYGIMEEDALADALSCLGFGYPVEVSPALIMNGNLLLTASIHPESRHVIVCLPSGYLPPQQTIAWAAARLLAQACAPGSTHPFWTEFRTKGYYATYGTPLGHELNDAFVGVVVGAEFSWKGFFEGQVFKRRGKGSQPATFVSLERVLADLQSGSDDALKMVARKLTNQEGALPRLSYDETLQELLPPLVAAIQKK